VRMAKAALQALRAGMVALEGEDGRPRGDATLRKR